MQLLGSVLEEVETADWQSVNNVRHGVFGLVLRAGLVGVIHAEHEGHHELPGGLSEGRETPHAAFRREIREELGVEIDQPQALAVIREVWFSRRTETFSHLLIARAIGEPQARALTQKELARGLQIKWLPFPTAKELIRIERPALVSGRMKHDRDLLALDFLHQQPVILRAYGLD